MQNPVVTMRVIMNIIRPPSAYPTTFNPIANEIDVIVNAVDAMKHPNLRGMP
jgi:hypothetical protein